jgi:hypothetical protein
MIYAAPLQRSHAPRARIVAAARCGSVVSGSRCHSKRSRAEGPRWDRQPLARPSCEVFQKLCCSRARKLNDHNWQIVEFGCSTHS